MDRVSLPHGQNALRTKAETLHSLQCIVTVTCADHGSHTAIVEGPFQQVMDLMATFREAAEMSGRWTLTTFQVLDELVPRLIIGDWD